MTASASGRCLSGGQRLHLGVAQRCSRLVSALVVFVILAALLVFFVLPAIWLVLAPTKTAYQLDHAFPLSFGSFGQLGQAWHDLATFQGGVIWQWLRNSAVYSAGALALTLVTSVPAGYALAMTKWNNFFLLYLVLPSSNEFPIQVGLNQLLSSTPSFNPVADKGLDITSPELALAIIIAILPVLVLFLFSQRALVSGMLAGSTKG